MTVRLCLDAGKYWSTSVTRPCRFHKWALSPDIRTLSKPSIWVPDCAYPKNFLGLKRLPNVSECRALARSLIIHDESDFSAAVNASTVGIVWVKCGSLRLCVARSIMTKMPPLEPQEVHIQSESPSSGLVPLFEADHACRRLFHTGHDQTPKQ